MKIKTKEPLKTFKGGTIKSFEGEELTIGEAISEILLMDKAREKMKLYILAQKFATEKELELDKADENMVRQAIEKSDIFNALVIGQLLMMFN